MTIMRLFSDAPTPGLSNWEFQFQYDPPALKAERELVSVLLVVCIIKTIETQKDKALRTTQATWLLLLD